MSEERKIGVVRTTITFLELDGKPARPPIAAPLDNHALMRAAPPSLPFYRYLYETVGAPWLWTSRRLMSDDALRAAIDRPEIEIFTLFVEGNPAGYFELDKSDPDTVDLVYFGLAPDFVGRRLGAYMLDLAIRQGFADGASKMRVETCDLDHPRALANYQRAGFRPVSTRAGSVVVLEGMTLPRHIHDRAIEPG